MQRSSIPAFDIVDHSGRRRRVRPASETDTVGDLARALGHRDGWATAIDGLPVAPGRRLTSVRELVEGVQVRFDEPARPSEAGTGDPTTTTAVDVGLEFAVVTGPSCRAWAPLVVGRHALGRSPHATIRLTDESAEVHHALVDVDPAGSIVVTQLTGRVPLLVVRAPTPIRDLTSMSSVCAVAAGGHPAGPFERLFPGDALVIGSTRIELRSRPPAATTSHGRGTVAELPGDPWHREVRRGPAVDPPPVESGLRPPDAESVIEMPAGTALVGAVVAFLGAIAIAGLLRQTMFAVFAFVGAIASGATWVVGALSVLRRRRSARRAGVLDEQRFIASLHEWKRSTLDRHRACHFEIVDVLAELNGDRALVWNRRLIDSGDAPCGPVGAIDVVIGRGAYRVEPPPDCDLVGRTDVLAAVHDASLLADVAVPIRLEPATAIAVRGETERVHALVRSMLVQVGTWIGPADLRIVVIGDPGEWAWVRWLPHARDAIAVLAPGDVEQLSGAVPSADGPAGTSTLLVIDDPALLAVRTGPLRRFMTQTGAATVVTVDRATSVPTVCRRTLTLSSLGGAEWSGGPAALTVAIAGLDAPTAALAARALAPLVDPEDADRAQARLPEQLSLAALDTVVSPSGTHDVVERWSQAGPDPTLRAPIGVSPEGTVEIDLVTDGPHALVAGTTGSGKSELLRTLVVSMASRVDPTQLNFVLIDYKGGSTFDSCARLPHTVGLVTDLDHGLAPRALVSLDAELGRRERMLRAALAEDLTEYRTHPDVEPIPRLVVIIDEFATLAHELPDFLTALVAIAQRGRSLGVHVVLATQRPAGVVTDDVRANTDLRIALRVNDAAEARDVVGDDLPATFPKSVPGRAMVRFAGDERVTFQAARCTGPTSRRVGRLRVSDPDSPDRPAAPSSVQRVSPTTQTELASAVDAIVRAAELLSLPPPRRPWLEPLPAVVDHATVDELVGHDPPGAHDAVGVVDDPVNQRRVPLRWDHSAGNLLLVGSLGSGRTSTIVALATALCRNLPPNRCHLYVIDAFGDRALDGLASVAHCGGVIRAGESERIDRLLRRLCDEIDRRSRMAGDASTLVPIVLFVDGLGELRRSLDSIERLAALAMLDRVLDAGPAVGVTSCLTVDGGTVTGSTSAADRWILRIDDPPIVRTPGHHGPAATRSNGAHRPGRLRVASSGLEAQVAIGAAGLAELPSRPDRHGPPDIAVLPPDVDGDALPTSFVSTDDGRPVRHLVVGLDSDRLEPAALCLPAGDHVFIGGAARTGKSTTLDRVAAAWADCVPDGTLVRWTAGGGDLRTRLDVLAGSEVLVVVDDAERVDDRDGVLAEIARGEARQVTIAAAARLDAVRGAYGHWTREVARSRCGLVMTAPGEIDGDLLGVVLPRRTAVPHRPGLGWLIDGRGHRLVQVAGRMPS